MSERNKPSAWSGDAPAHPVECYWDACGPSQGVQTGNQSGWAMGVTVHDYFAAKVLQGIYANPSLSDLPHERLAKAASDAADAYITYRDGR